MKIILHRAVVVLFMSSSLWLAPLAHAGSANDSLRIADAELNAAYQKALAVMPNA
jgi:uncharacterized membrane protein